MNIENDFIRNEKSQSIISYAYVNFIVRTRILSTKEFVFAIQTKAFQTKFESRSIVIKKQHENFKKTFCLVVKKTKDSVSRKTIEEVVHININFVNSSIEFRIVLKILQQSDQFAQKKNDLSCFVNHWKDEIRTWFKRKEMKNEEWHFTFRRKILHFHESFTKKIV
jgi:hypothetical protein